MNLQKVRPLISSLRAQARPLLERESVSRGSLALLLAVAAAGMLVATLQARFQRHELMSAEVWGSVPLGADPAATVVGWLAAAIAFRSAVTRINADTESLWVGTLHAQGQPAWSYAMAILAVSTLAGLAALIFGCGGLAASRHLVPPPEWAAWPWPRMSTGAVALVATFAAVGTLAAIVVRGAALATGAVISVLALPFIVQAVLVTRGASMGLQVVPYIYRLMPPLQQNGSYELLLWQGGYVLALLTFILVLSRTRLTRRF